MCGIAGIFNTRSEDAPQTELINRMTDAITHRGPDESGIHLEPGLALGHRRLSVIDIASGQQPLFNEDRSAAIVFNGEIYNFMQLRPELEALGYRFTTHSDTEVILHAWQAWGSQCVQRLRGMFAFAIWDQKRRHLFLARDRLGIKPLYYALLPNGHFVFGSELKALLPHPALPRDRDPMAIEEYFAYGYIPEPRTIFSGVRKLPPGHTLLIEKGQTLLPRTNQYWDIPFTDSGLASQDSAESELIERLREAVDIRLVAEVPLGAFLSGGVDSSAIVALMAGLVDQPVKTCSIGFDEAEFDETAYALKVAERYHTDHRTDTVKGDDFALVDKLGWLFDEPFADSSAMPTYRVCEAARKRVTVALSGDGGDENLAGYRRYRMHMAEEQLRSRLPLGLRKAIFGPLGALYPKADWAPRVLRAKTTFQALARDSVGAWFHSVSRMTDEQRRTLFSPALRNDLGGYNAVEVLRRHAAQSPTDHPLSLVQYLDLKTFLVSILHKVDRASMAHALEVRVPLLDHKLVEWMSGLRPEWKLAGSDGKHLFKHALKAYLPDDIMYRPKQGFSIPLAQWFRGPLRERYQREVLGESMADSGLFNNDYLGQLLQQHDSGLRDNSVVMWELLMFALSDRHLASH
ncbi:MAG TPA: amidotransferase 1, exosortase A system-associated [Gammaproteobacteria bacterium]|nr:amidotransferase 1, exosortase A system-associated [Chromatiaceae bacterium]HOP17513.1 amidotransferase 1, exosortase A system-associated [Gammaproteobacteria bacterium]HPQ25839.1 amidotransferase 1, exosortase A system-associated [Gammaproteobacteria bacterium]